ncbi:MULTISPECIES: S8 family serine peptidase [unclassified Thermoactinomyces]|uniref:S8 family peptidase n=1 Tax=unclassified Thermoactinomyces TaxID=2634588 RepID=UPI0009ECE686|nr:MULTISPECIES: S8 family serine peptidase [unclassified Thermoactinomyces]MBH8586260.1 S8 family serine peptidase [Thermoactinomyces sp. CICC 10520]MBI0387246.1 S8 family serine peptidase [Thermoactinomyces sp. CICC 24227]
MINRKRAVGLFFLFFVFILLLSAVTLPMMSTPGSLIASRKWVVKWRQPAPSSFWMEAELLEEGGEGLYLVQTKPGTDEERWVETWKEDPGIEFIGPDIRYELGKEKNRRRSRVAFGKNYYLQQIRIPKAWDYFRKKADPDKIKPVTVAVVDTGVDLSHPVLKPFLTEGVNVKNPDLPPQDHFGHGTKVAGVIASTWGAREGKPVGKGRIMPVKVMENDGDGEIFYTVKGIREAIQRGADIIVLSQGSWTYSKLMEDAVEEAESRGVLVVAAAGNAEFDEKGELLFSQPLYYPAAFPSVLSVGATDFQGKHEPFSNTGLGLDIVAPGDMIYTTSNGQDYAFDSGTSFSTPQVAGVAALVWQLRPDYTPGDIRMLLRQTASSSPHWNEKTGFGMLDADRALRSPLDPDIGEPNDSEQTATPFFLSQEIRLVLQKGDPDWYVLDLNKAGRLQIDVEVLDGPGKDVILSIIQSTTGQTRSRSLLAQSGKQRIITPVSQGKILLKWSVSQASKQEVALRFHAAYLPEEDEYEANDLLSQAALLPLSETKNTFSATISRPGDADWYQLLIPKEGRLVVQVQPLTPRFDPVIFKIRQDDWDKMRQDEEREGRTETLSLDVKPGPFYFRVTDYAGNLIEDPYHLIVSFEPK